MPEGIRKAMIRGFNRGISNPRKLPKVKKKKVVKDNSAKEIKKLREEIENQQVFGGWY